MDLTRARNLLLTGISLAFIFSCQTFAGDKELQLPSGTLDRKQIAELFWGKTAAAEFAKGDQKDKFIYFKVNGGVNQVQEGRLTEGRWKVRKDGRLCVKLEGKKRRCRIIVKSGDQHKQYIVKLDGNHKHELTYVSFKEGNQLAKMSKAPILPPGTLTRKEVITLFSGNTVESVTVRKKRVSLSFYDPDGTIEQVRNGKKRYGKWRVKKNGRICLQMENLREKCRIIVYEKGKYNKYIVKKNGRHQNSVTYRQFIPGKQF